ncbi:type II toxin-antitoxin system PemK/MazF family toxin [Desulfosporosinus sp. FKB]|uniref:type II toxin-antitoxin system PemK/MazF family toxin n=1 Tax=Desulfosporosinus sp. FKB TaxID=1969835 RepID=UPI000B4A2DFC
MHCGFQAGHEQRGTRPALVLSLKEYNSKTGMGIFCPETPIDYPLQWRVYTAYEEVRSCIKSVSFLKLRI